MSGDLFTSYKLLQFINEFNLIRTSKIPLFITTHLSKLYSYPNYNSSKQKLYYKLSLFSLKSSCYILNIA